MLLALTRGLTQGLCGMLGHQCILDQSPIFLFLPLISVNSFRSFLSELSALPKPGKMRTGCARAVRATGTIQGLHKTVRRWTRLFFSSVKISDVKKRPVFNVNLLCNPVVPAVQLPAALFMIGNHYAFEFRSVRKRCGKVG